MKNSPADRPRFTCRVVRGCLSIFGDTSTGRPRGLGASHVAACEDCQQFFGACDELAVALKRDAVREWREAPTNLEQNIIRAVNQSARESAPSRGGTRVAWISLAAVATCVVAAVLVFQQRRTPLGSPADNVAATPADPAATAAVEQIVTSVPADLFSQFQPEAKAILKQDPLQNEVDAVKSDARTAVRFLARNFLPASADDAAGGE